MNVVKSPLQPTGISVRKCPSSAMGVENYACNGALGMEDCTSDTTCRRAQCAFVSWCSEPSQPLRIILGLRGNGVTL